MKKMIMLLLIAAIAVPAAAEAEQKFYGYQWIRYVLQYDGELQSKNEIIIPRTYLRWKIDDSAAGYSGRITLEVANVKEAQDNIDWGLWLKYGYVDFYKLPFLENIKMRLRAGVQPVYFGMADVWDYPLVEKSLEDRNSFTGTSDLGIALVGIAAESLIKYEIALYNGSGYKHVENDEFKKMLASVQFNLFGSVFLRISSALQNTISQNAYVAAYDSDKIKGYMQYLRGWDNAAGNMWSITPYAKEGYSFYLGAQIFEKIWLNLRTDKWNPGISASANDINTWISGLQFEFSENIGLQFNYELTQRHGMPNKNLWLTQLEWSW